MAITDGRVENTVNPAHTGIHYNAVNEAYDKDAQHIAGRGGVAKATEAMSKGPNALIGDISIDPPVPGGDGRTGRDSAGERVFQESASKLQPKMDAVGKLYDQTTFIGPNRSFPGNEHKFEEALKTLMPDLEKAFNQLTKGDRNNEEGKREFYEKFLPALNKSLNDQAVATHRTGEIPRVSYWPGDAPSQYGRGYPSGVALDIGDSRTVVIEGRTPEK